MVFKSGLNDFLDKNKNRSDQRISLKIEAIFLTRHFLFIFVFLFDSTQKVTHFRHFSFFSTPFQSIQSFYTFFCISLVNSQRISSVICGKSRHSAFVTRYAIEWRFLRNSSIICFLKTGIWFPYPHISKYLLRNT